MAKMFPLAGLLRLRRLQEDTAAGHLAEANGRLREIHSSQTRALHALQGFANEAADVTTLRAIASARASSGSMLAELRATAAMHRLAAADAEDDFRAARTKTISIEKLGTKHATAEAAADLRDEQIALDEIASGSWQRTSAERARAAKAEPGEQN